MILECFHTHMKQVKKNSEFFTISLDNIFKKASLPKVQKALLSWRLQCITVVQPKGYQTDYSKHKYFL